jgi:hypothetical protein
VNWKQGRRNKANYAGIVLKVLTSITCTYIHIGLYSNSVMAPLYPTELEKRNGTASEFGFVFGVHELAVAFINPGISSYVSRKQIFLVKYSAVPSMYSVRFIVLLFLIVRLARCLRMVQSRVHCPFCQYDCVRVISHVLKIALPFPSIFDSSLFYEI